MSYDAVAPRGGVGCGFEVRTIERRKPCALAFRAALRPKFRINLPAPVRGAPVHSNAKPHFSHRVLLRSERTM